MIIIIIILVIGARLRDLIVYIVILSIHPVRIARFHVPRFSPRVGLPRNLFVHR